MNSTMKLIVCAIIALVSIHWTPTALAQDIDGTTARLRVDGSNGSATPANYGATWGSGAYLYLQDALADAEDLIDNDPDVDAAEIWVAAGIYYPDEDAITGAGGDDDEMRSFDLRENVQILGGFTGDTSETNRNQRNWVANETKLSGNIDQTGAAWDPHNNSYRVVTASSVDDTAILNGFTVRDGVGPGMDGAGVYVTNASPVILNCRIAFNQANGDGPGIFIDGAPIIVNCHIENNASYSATGGGIYLEGGVATMTNCLIDNNFALDYAGGVCINHGEMTMTNCTVAWNYGYAPAGIYLAGGSLDMRNSILWKNNDSLAESQQLGPETVSIAVEYSCISGLDYFGGNNNIDDDPEFVDDDQHGDYHLTSSSNVINLADNSNLLADTFDVDEDGNTTEVVPDLEWTPRVVASDVDMGAFELQCLGDIDADGDVDFDDFTALLANYGSCGDPCFSDCPADLDGDCEVDFDDFTALLANFGACDVSGVGLDDTLLELFLAAGLNQDDYDDYLDIMENGTQQQKDCWTAWVDHYLNCSPSCAGSEVTECDDPFLTN